jgi:4-amino-4-deoxy-L-arabinose transferase-like glycosyltransferase
MGDRLRALATPRVMLSAGFILTAIIVAGVILRFYRFNAPLLDQHEFRQTQTASEVWLWHRFGFAAFEYHVPMYGGGFWVLEFPWYQYIVYALGLVFGLHEQLGRIVSILAFVACAYLLFEIGKRLLGSRAAAVAAVVFLTFMPATVFFYRAFLIDPTLIAVGLLMFLAAIRLWERFSWTWTAVFVVAFFVTALGKANLIVVFSLPIIVLIVRALMARRLPWKGFAVLAAGVVVSAITLWLWTRHADALNVPSNGQTFANMRWWYFGSTVFDANLWHTVFNRFLDNLNLVGLLFVGIGLTAIATLRSGHRLVIVALIASGLMSIAVFANLNRVHDYYQLPYYPTIALLGGLGVWSVGSLALRISRERAIQLTAGILAGLAMGWTITLFHSSYFADAALDMATLGTATELAQHTPDQPLLYLADGADPNEPMVLYEARRLGWRVATSDEAQAKQRVAAATDLGAIAVQKGAGGVPAWVAPLAATKGFHLSWDGPTFAIYSK